MMTQTFPPAGAAPVSRLTCIPETQAWVVRALRLIGDGASGRTTLRCVVSDRLGSANADAFLTRFEDLVGLFARHGRRKLALHHLECDCVGADEAIIAHFLDIAALGEREDAMLVAILLLRADVVPIAVSLAQTLGLELRRSIAYKTMH